MEKNSKIYVAGASGMVGSSILRALNNKGFKNVITSDSNELDLRNQSEVKKYFYQNKFDYVFLAAAKVGGILANSTRKAEFIFDNLQIQNNLIHFSYETDVRKILFLGSSCIYPKESKIPIKENELLTGRLEETNDAYAIAKIAGIKLCQSYRYQYNFNAISVMPTNLYGYNDNFDLTSSHVLPALIRKFVSAKENNESCVTCWGSGKPLREFLFVDDLADACLFLMNNYDEVEHINVGTGKDLSIFDLANIIKNEVGFSGSIEWDISKPDGTYRKMLDVSKLQKLGWEAKTSLEEGIRFTLNWYNKHKIDCNG